MTRKLGFIIFATLSILVGLYPVLYFIVDSKIGILSSKSDLLLGNDLWNIGFYLHISLGGLALLIGWTQFVKSIRKKNISLHRNLGKVYMISVIFSGFAALFISYFATGGIIASLGFACLAVVWLYTTIRAFLEVKNQSIRNHQKFMIYSYAACFAAVTLRVWLPVLSAMFQDFVTAYRIVAWLCWIPNLIVAKIIVGQLKLNRIK